MPRRGHVRKVVIRCKVPAPPLAFCKRHPVCKPRINKLHVPVTTTYLEACAEGKLEGKVESQPGELFGDSGELGEAVPDH